MPGKAGRRFWSWIYGGVGIHRGYESTGHGSQRQVWGQSGAGDLGPGPCEPQRVA